MRVPLIILIFAALPVVEVTRSQEPEVPALPSTPSHPAFNGEPVTALFRKLLVAKSEEEQKALLASKSPEARTILVEKLEEYRAMRPAEREHRLRLLDLRAYISQLRGLKPEDRVAGLQRIPENDRQIVRERLAIWDSLTSKQREQVWLYDITKNYLVSPPTPPSPPGLNVSQKQSRLEEIAERWSRYPAEQREEIVGYFKRIFEDDPANVSAELAQQNQEQLRRTIEKLKRLPAVQREKCLIGFTRFVELPKAGREQFLNNVTVWATLTPDARAALTTLTEHLPPLPPGFYDPPAPPTEDFPPSPQ